MFEFHKQKEQYFNFQYLTSRDYIIPFIEEFFDLNRPLNVLEIGCAEAGVLKAFVEKGHRCIGIELSEGRISLAKQFQAEAYEKGQIDFLSKDIYKINVEKDLPFLFDLIILKDVIEHIHEQERLIPELAKFLNPGGKIFFGFPPWYMPFGGHQQVCSSKWLSKLPYYHLLPRAIYKAILKAGGEKPTKIESLLEIKETGISIERFEKIVNKQYNILKRTYFLINPIYKYKFNIKPRKQNVLVNKMPFVRNFLTTAMYYLIEPKEYE